MTMFSPLSFVMPSPQLDLSDGLAACLLREGPEMWHEFALGLDLDDPRGGIDLLIAADLITRDPACDRATAALILARLVTAGFHRGASPAALDAGAGAALLRRIAGDLAQGQFAVARLGLPPLLLRLVRAELAQLGGMSLPHLGRQAHRPPYGFAGWRPVLLPAAARTRAA